MSDSKDPLRYFRIEAKEISEEMSRAVLQLEHAGSPASVARLLRLAHTLKGAAGIVRQGAIAECAHALEDALAPHREREGALEPGAFAALLAQSDAIAALVAAIEKPNKPGGAAPQATEEDLAVIHAETADIDLLLDGIGEAGVRLRGLRAAGGLALQAGQLCGQLAERLAALPRQDGAVETMDALRELVARLERQLGGGLDLVERELRQVRGQAQRLRLLPCGAMMTALERAARNAARACGKEIRFESGGGEIRLDARVLFTVQRALVQLVRNAVAHGIELPQARCALGKPVAGRIAVEITRSGGQVCFVCRDDGAGINLEALRAAARRRGIPDGFVETAGADELLRGGLSTAEAVTEIAGRGVGLDIAREAAAQLGGRLQLGSEKGGGTRIEITVPATLSAVEALLVESGGGEHAIPLAMVRRTLRRADAQMMQTPEGARIAQDEGLLPLVALADLLAADPAPGGVRPGAVLIVAGASACMALTVDRILGADDIVVRALPGGTAVDALVGGLAIGADGTPRLVLDADGLIAAASRLAAPDTGPERTPLRPILVIDDSLTTRVLEQSILESAGYAVDQAISAEEGLQKARARRYGLILVDVEMPGMGGFAFVEMLRADPGLRDIPAILVTSRDAPEDRQRGLDAGANDYVVKGAFNQTRFLATVRNLLEAV